MPRLARLDAAGVLHHVIIRGIERRSIFEDDKDRDDFLKRLWGIIACHQNHLLCLCDVIRPCTLAFAYGNNWAFNGNEKVADRILIGLKSVS
jgi:hypothetical protein